MRAEEVHCRRHTPLLREHSGGCGGGNADSDLSLLVKLGEAVPIRTRALASSL